jgi:orotidine-5'-phosphate decarboxylase
MEVKDKICIALDVDAPSEAVEIVTKLRDLAGFFKVGAHLFTIAGPAIVQEIKAIGGKVFLDLKYHDIPNTVRNTARAIARMGVSIFNVHALGGHEMMAETASAIQEEASRIGLPKPLVLGVTVLTSINSSILSEELKVMQDLGDYVIHLAKLAKKAGLDGVVASGLKSSRYERLVAVISRF